MERTQEGQELCKNAIYFLAIKKYLEKMKNEKTEGIIVVFVIKCIEGSDTKASTGKPDR